MVGPQRHSHTGRAAPRSPISVQRNRDLAFRLHSFNRDSFNLALLKYRDFQGFLITGQHSGTHWIKWMLSHALARRYEVPPPRYFDNASSNDLIGHPKHPREHPHAPRLASSHSIAPHALSWAWLRGLAAPPPYVVVVRDIRDVLVSNYEKWRHAYGVSFADYVAGDPRGRAYVCDVWWYLRFKNRWGDVASRFPDQTLVLRYEDFQADRIGALRQIARHFGLPLTSADLAFGAAAGSKARMARHRDPDIDQQALRPTGVGDAALGEAEHAILRDILGRHLRHDFGYDYLPEARGLQVAPLQARRSQAA